jgi:tryptophan-rich sensory protein
LLVVIWVASFVCFAVASQLAFVSGTTFEYRLYGVQSPFVAFALLACMSASSGLLWANYRRQDFRGAEELIYGCFFGLSAFGLMLSVVLVLMA